jgi:hypothetical protein
MRLEGTISILDFDPFSTRTEADATHELGIPVRLADGRTFRHGVAGAAVSKGKLSQAAPPIPNHANISVAAAALGATAITATPGATAGNANIYAEGYMAVNDVDGEGATYKIKDHLAITASTAFVVNLFDPITGTALTANSQVTLVHNAYNLCIEGTVATTRPSGVPLISIASGDYGWYQTRGVAAVLAGTTRTLGAWQVASGATAGAVVDMTDVTAPVAERQAGIADIIAGVDTEYNPMTLTID